jgi:hypothetical protein
VFNSSNEKRHKDIELNGGDRMHLFLDGFIAKSGKKPGSFYDVELIMYNAQGKKFSFYIGSQLDLLDTRKALVEALGMLDGVVMRYQTNDTSMGSGEDG